VARKIIMTKKLRKTKKNMKYIAREAVDEAVRAAEKFAPFNSAHEAYAVMYNNDPIHPNRES
jgi:hypothetical protein